MKLPVALGIAAAALTVVAASAHTNRVFISSNGSGNVSIDANEDGWITRSEASSAFEEAFANLDTNDDGRLDDEDRHEFRVHIDGPEVTVLEGDDDDSDGRTIRIIRHGEELDEDIQREVERAMEEAERHIERAERQAEEAERRAEQAERLAERHAERAERDAERRAERIERLVERHGERLEGRNVIIIRDGDDVDWVEVPPIPPVPPIAALAPLAPLAPLPPAMPFMMLIANSEEADRNGDGALSREEFVAQHLRFFDASDVNGDGRVRFEAPPEPPEAPRAPTPPEPPRRR